VVGIPAAGFVLLMIMGACLAAVGVANSDGEPVVTQPLSTAAASNGGGKVTASVGQTVRDGKLAFTVTGVKQASHVGSDVIGDDAQGVFWLVSVKVENIGHKPQVLLSSAQHAYAGGSRYDTSGSELYLADANTFFQPINPGNVVNGTLLFDVPRGTRLDTIELHDSLLSGGVRVALP